MEMDINRKIKIAQVITRLDWGGSPDIVRIICTHLEPESYDVMLVTGSTKYPTVRTRGFLEKFSGRTVIIPRLKREINLLMDLSALVSLYLLFRREKFDIVHTHTAKAGVLARLAAYFARVPVIIHTPHGHNFYGYFGICMSKIIIAVERFVARFTDRIIVFTELEKKDFIRFRVADTEKVSLIYQGLELERYTQVNIDKVKSKKAFGIAVDEDVIGMIGRLEPIKGPGYFVEAAEEVAKKFTKTKFIVVGEGGLRQRLENQVEGMGLKDRFIFTGWREDIPEILSIMDILVLPSLNEAVGIVLIEAQVLGVPVVATNVGGIPEIVIDGMNGILIPPRDPQALAQAVVKLLKDEALRRKMGDAGREWVRDRFSVESMIEKLEKLYKDLKEKR